MLVRPRSGGSPFQPFVEDVMAARRTGMKMTGIALASLCLNTTARAQVLFSASSADCIGMVCVPITSFVTFPGTGITPRWTSFGASPVSTGFAIRANQNAQGDQEEDLPGTLHFNNATPAYTGIAFTVVAFLMNNSNGDTPVSGDAPPVTVVTPLTAHLDFGETSAVVTNPEPMSAALTATGLLALGVGVLLRRRRRSIG